MVAKSYQAFLRLTFFPEPLPPKPELEIDGNLRELLDQTLLALGRLDVKAVVAKNATAQIEDGREAIRQIEYYNLRLFPLFLIVFVVLLFTGYVYGTYIVNIHTTIDSDQAYLY